MSTKASQQVKQFDETNAAVGFAALEDVGNPIILNGRYSTITFEVDNGDVALGDFALLIQPHQAADFHVCISASDWEDEQVVVKPWVSAALQTLDASTKAAGRVEIGGCYAVKFQAKSSGADTAVTVRGTITSEETLL